MMKILGEGAMFALSPVRFSRVALSFTFVTLFAAAASAAEFGPCDATDKGKDGQQQTTVSAINQLAPFPGGSAAISAAKEYISKAKQCAKDGKAAMTQCQEQCNKEFQEGVKRSEQIGADQVKAGASAKEANQREAQKTINEAENYKYFMKVCAPPKGSCSSGCNEAYQKLQETSNKVSQVNCQSLCSKVPADPQCQPCTQAKAAATSQVSNLLNAEGNQGDIEAVKGKQAKCDGDLTKNQSNAGNMLAALAPLLAEALKNMGNSGDGTTATPEVPLQTASTDCNLEANRYTENCKCQLPYGNPRAPGCPGADTASAGVAGMGGSTVPELGTNNSTPAPTLPPSDTSAPTIPSGGDMAMPAGMGMAGGGFGGGMGGGGASKGADGAGGAKGDAKKSASVYAGDGGGGGGGGGGYGGYGSDSTGKAKPAGAGGVRGIAGKVATAANHNVTGAGGRTNWQKVSERYMDNTPTLLKDDKAFFSSDRVAPGK